MTIKRSPGIALNDYFAFCCILHWNQPSAYFGNVTAASFIAGVHWYVSETSAGLSGRRITRHHPIGWHASEAGIGRWGQVRCHRRRPGVRIGGNVLDWQRYGSGLARCNHAIVYSVLCLSKNVNVQL
jgi:hypothetical protein